MALKDTRPCPMQVRVRRWLRCFLAAQLAQRIVALYAGSLWFVDLAIPKMLKSLLDLPPVEPQVPPAALKGNPRPHILQWKAGKWVTLSTSSSFQPAAGNVSCELQTFQPTSMLPAIGLPTKGVRGEGM